MERQAAKAAKNAKVRSFFFGVLGVLGTLALIWGCGPKVQTGTWVERDSELGRHSRHETESKAPSKAPPVHIDLSKLDPLTIDELDEATAIGVLEQLGDKKPAARVGLRAARLAHHRGDDADARALLARAASAADEAEVHADLGALAKATAAAPVDPNVVAVLLPLSGRFQAIGAELRAAIELVPPDGSPTTPGAGVNPAPSISGPKGKAKWLFIDTKGEPDGAAAAVDTAAQKGAVAILGPVGTREAVAAARAASLHGIPIALLAPSDGADPAAGVFRLVSSPGDEARAVAKLAIDDNFPTVGVFAPRDDVGQDAADAFVAEATRLGVRVTAQGTYDPTGGKLEPDVKQFLNLIPSKNPELAAHLRKNPKDGWKTFTPAVQFTLLYVPDRYDRAAIVAAFLPYFGVELRTGESTDPNRLQRKHGGVIPQIVQLVGGAGWHHPSLPTRGGAAVQGALIVDVFGAESGGDLAVAFNAAFQQKTGRAASSAAAEANDAATLVAQARFAAAAAADPRTAFRSALAHGKLADGACGPAAIETDGELVRTPLILEVQGDELVPAP
ncbi:MAG TPA: penicillin-binding protein activator [Kofleriaceae bacterium]|nr:penicillin-binding protein activator [Kofleriaceae bacterium]